MIVIRTECGHETEAPDITAADISFGPSFICSQCGYPQIIEPGTPADEENVVYSVHLNDYMSRVNPDWPEDGAGTPYSLQDVPGFIGRDNMPRATWGRETTTDRSAAEFVIDNSHQYYPDLARGAGRWFVAYRPGGTLLGEVWTNDRAGFGLILRGENWDTDERYSKGFRWMRDALGFNGASAGAAFDAALTAYSDVAGRPLQVHKGDLLTCLLGG